MPRLFVAIELPEDVCEALSALQQRLKRLDTARAVRWSNSDGIHLTLKFLGDVPEKQVDDIKAHLQRAAQTVQPFALTLEGTGVFPDFRAPRIVWAGLQGQLATLHALRDAVEREIAPLGYPTDERPFSPHLTLARPRNEARHTDQAALGAQLEKYKAGTLASFTASEVSLMESTLRPEGAIYTARARYTLAQNL